MKLEREAPPVYRIFFTGGNQTLCHSLVANVVSKTPRRFLMQEGIAPCSAADLLVGRDIEDEAVVLCSHSKLIHLGISQMVFPKSSMIQGKVRVCEEWQKGGSCVRSEARMCCEFLSSVCVCVCECKKPIQYAIAPF